MADFKGLVYTNKGAELIAKTIGDKETITITKMVTTDLMYNESQIKVLEEINEQKQTIPQLSVKKVEGTNKVQVFAAFRNTKLDEGYYLRAYGIYAKTDNTNEILFAVASVDDKNKGDWINASSGLNIVDISITSVMVLSNVKLQELLITADGGVTIEQFEKHTLMRGGDNVHGATVEPSENSLITRTEEGYAKANYPDDETDIDENTIITKKKLKLVEQVLADEVNKGLNPNNILRWANNTSELSNYSEGQTIGILDNPYGNISSTSSIRVMYDYRDNKYIERYKRVRTEHSVYLIDYGKGKYWGIPQYNTNSSFNIAEYNKSFQLNNIVFTYTYKVGINYVNRNTASLNWIGWRNFKDTPHWDKMNKQWAVGFEKADSTQNIPFYWNDTNLLLDFKTIPKESLHNRLKIERNYNISIDPHTIYYQVGEKMSHFNNEVNTPYNFDLCPIFNSNAASTGSMGFSMPGKNIMLDTVYSEYQIHCEVGIIFLVDNESKIKYSHPVLLTDRTVNELSINRYETMSDWSDYTLSKPIQLQLVRKQPDDGKLYWCWNEKDKQNPNSNTIRLEEITDPDNNPTKELKVICDKIKAYYSYQPMPIEEPSISHYMYENKLVQAGPSGNCLYWTDLFLYEDRLKPVDYVK